MIANAMIAMSFVVMGVLVGWLACGLLVQRRELDACARTLHGLVEVFNASPAVSPEGPRVLADPELPHIPPREAPADTETIVKVGGVVWEEWREGALR